MDNLRLRFEYEAVSGFGEGAFVDDVMIGFAERGELVTGSISNPTFTGNPNPPANQILIGDYQLEIRKASDIGSSGFVATTGRATTVWGIQPGTQQIVQIDPSTGIVVGQFDTPDTISTGQLVEGLSMAEGIPR